MAAHPPLAHTTEDTRRLVLAWFFLAGLQGLLATGLFFVAPSESGALLLGLSATRLAFAAALLLVSMLLLAAAFWMRRQDPAKLGPARALPALARPHRWQWLLVLCAAGVLLGLFLVTLTPEIEETFTRVLLQRLMPLIVWFTGLCLQSLVLFSAYFIGRAGLRELFSSRILRGALLLWGFFLLVWAWVAWTRIGMVIDPTGWNVQGAPLTEIHALLAWLAGVGFLSLIAWAARTKPDPPRRLDLLAAVAIWVAALGYWLLVPLPESWFVTEPIPPNFEFFPNSDALIYDTTGQSMLVGEPFKSWDQPFPRRPMYALFLAGLRTLTAQQYPLTAALQVGALALFPVLIYLLGRSLDTRLAGLFGATLVILREGSGIAASGSITVSHSRLLMSDLPNALGVLLFALLVVLWLQQARAQSPPQAGLALLAGAVLGTTMLIRPESGALLAAAGGVAWLVLRQQPRRWLVGMAVMALGLGLILAPWVWRNYRLTGQIFLERPGNRLDFLFERFGDVLVPGSLLVLPDVSAAAPAAVRGGIPALDPARFFIQAQADPDADQPAPSFLESFATHFVHSQTQLALMLPATIRLPEAAVGFLAHREADRFYGECCTTISYLRRLPFWFDEPMEGFNLPRQSVIPLLVNLFVLSLGLSTAWDKQRWLGLLPLSFALLYTLVTALARTSGGRYLLAVDWVSILYFSIGLSQLTLWGLRALTGIPVPQRWLEPEPVAERRPAAARLAWLLPLALLLASALLLATIEALIPPRYDAERTQAMYDSILTVDSALGLDWPAMEAFQQNGGLILSGRALYPRFYPAQRGAPGNPGTDAWAGMARPSFFPQPFARMGFYLVGPRNLTVLLPADTPADIFPHGADVVVFGCPTEAFLQARVVAVFAQDGTVAALYGDGDPRLQPCGSAP
jgi:hypothetical protein